MCSGGSLSPKFFRRRRLGRRTGLDSTTSDLEGTTEFSEHTSSSRLSTSALGKTGSRLPSFEHDDVMHATPDALMRSLELLMSSCVTATL